MFSKRLFLGTLIVWGSAVVFSGCTAAVSPQPAHGRDLVCGPAAASSGALATDAPPLVIEAESMALTAAEIVPASGASGERAVKLLPDAVATVEIPLPGGQYVLNAFFLADDHDHDGFFLVADDQVKRTNAHRHKQWVYGAKFLIFETDGSKPVVARFASRREGLPAAESGMLVDRLEIAEFGRSAALLQRWTE